MHMLLAVVREKSFIVSTAVAYFSFIFCVSFERYTKRNINNKKIGRAIATINRLLLHMCDFSWPIIKEIHSKNEPEMNIYLKFIRMHICQGLSRLVFPFIRIIYNKRNNPFSFAIYNFSLILFTFLFPLAEKKLSVSKLFYKQA